MSYKEDDFKSKLHGPWPSRTSINESMVILFVEYENWDACARLTFMEDYKIFSNSHAEIVSLTEINPFLPQLQPD